MEEGMALNAQKDESYGALQEVVTALFADAETEEVSRLDVVLAAESADLPGDILEVVSLLPPGAYTRQRLCDQLNSAMNGHAWGQVYGTVE